MIYVDLNGNHKAKLLVNAQKKMSKESKHNTKSHQATRKERMRRTKEQRGTTKKPENNEQNGNQFIPINNYFNWKWTKSYNHNTEWLNGFFLKRYVYTLPTGDSLQK